MNKIEVNYGDPPEVFNACAFVMLSDFDAKAHKGIAGIEGPKKFGFVEAVDFDTLEPVGCFDYLKKGMRGWCIQRDGRFFIVQTEYPKDGEIIFRDGEKEIKRLPPQPVSASISVTQKAITAPTVSPNAKITMTNKTEWVDQADGKCGKFKVELPSPARQLAKVAVTCDLLLSLFREGFNNEEGRQFSCVKGVPEDAIIVGALMNHETGNVEIFLRSDEFAAIPEGSAAPYLDVWYRSCQVTTSSPDEGKEPDKDDEQDDPKEDVSWRDRPPLF